MKKPAVFLDRDGTINKDVPYCSSPEEFELLLGVGEAIARLNKAGLVVVVITNQSGVARSYFTEGALQLIHQKMQEDLTRYQARVDAIYYCPHHPDEGCSCRKPEPDLIFQAAEDLNLDLKNSFFIGDSINDVEAGRRARCATVFIDQNQNGRTATNCRANYICRDLVEAVEWIIKNIELKC
jgi:D,D-heptose 1,7-bisphosphate phosphatase